MNPLVPDGQGQPMPGQAPQQMEPPPSPQEIAQARARMSHYSQALQGLVALPNLTKQDVFKASADLIAKGAFPTPESQMQLIQELTQLPEDNGALRQALGKEILEISHATNHLNGMYGAGDGGGV